MPALEGALKLANHHRATALAERISAFIEQRLALEAAAAELDEGDDYGAGEAGRQVRTAVAGGQGIRRSVRLSGRSWPCLLLSCLLCLMLPSCKLPSGCRIQPPRS